MIYFSQKQNIFFVEREAFTRFKPGLFWSEENVQMQQGWNVMKSILVSQQEILQRGSRNILRPLPLSMTILSSLVTVSLLTTSV